jgi:ribosomal-protein-alanine N-acetyltransferase
VKSACFLTGISLGGIGHALGYDPPAGGAGSATRTLEEGRAVVGANDRDEPASQPGLTFRLMRDTDVPEVLAVEEASYLHPWSKDIFHDCLRAGYHCWVLQVGDHLVGHGVMSLAVGECQILNLCVHPDWQGQQFGRRLLRRLLAIARQRNADTAFLEVRRSNGAAIHLYQAEGFCEVGLRRGYYPKGQGREDAILMAKPL